MRLASAVSGRLAQADLLLLAAELLRPGQRFAPAVCERTELRLLARAAGRESLYTRLREACGKVAAVSPEARELELVRLFDAPAVCPINETAYVRRDKGAVLADICGFYRAFGFEPAETTAEKPDHLVAELEFCAVLLLMEAQARRQRQRRHATTTRDALRAFLTDHLAVWWPAFCRRLGQTAELEPLRAVARLHQAVCAYLTRALGVRPATGDVEARKDEGTPYECGLATPPVVPLGAGAAVRGGTR